MYFLSQYECSKRNLKTSKRYLYQFEIQITYSIRSEINSLKPHRAKHSVCCSLAIFIPKISRSVDIVHFIRNVIKVNNNVQHGVTMGRMIERVLNKTKWMFTKL